MRRVEDEDAQQAQRRGHIDAYYERARENAHRILRAAHHAQRMYVEAEARGPIEAQHEAHEQVERVWVIEVPILARATAWLLHAGGVIVGEDTGQAWSDAVVQQLAYVELATTLERFDVEVDETAVAAAYERVVERHGAEWNKLVEAERHAWGHIWVPEHASSLGARAGLDTDVVMRAVGHLMPLGGGGLAETTWWANTWTLLVVGCEQAAKDQRGDSG